MARPRQFDEQEVLQKALMCFWKNGYEGTSLAELEKATGIGRISLYNTFKDKKTLFIAAQNMYFEMSDQLMATALHDQADLEDLENFITNMMLANPEDEPARYGCLMVNTALDVIDLTSDVVGNVKDYRSMILGHYERFFARLKTEEKINNTISAKDAAEFVVGALWGAMAVTRLYNSRNAAKPQLDVLMTVMKSWH